MKLIYLLLFFASSYAILPVKSQQFVAQWLEIPLDHFNLFDNRTWKMRYVVNDQFFQEGKPLFVSIGGEWTLSGRDLVTGQLYLLGKQHHGMIVDTEHRYYGKSLPFGTDFSTENLKFLQMEQALEDFVYFIEKFKSSRPGLQNSKVVVHGCSYAGMLVTWLRLRFPHIVDIAYASSAPLGVGLEYPEYFEVVNEVYANVSQMCNNTLREGFKTTSDLMKTRDGRKIVKNALREWNCGDVEDLSSGDILTQMLDLLNTQADSVVAERVACATMSMDSDELSAFERLAKLVIMRSQSRCGGDGGEEDELSTRTNLAWYYQTCTEIGSVLTLSRENSRHPFQLDANVEESVDRCADDFGGIVTQEVLLNGVERVTRRYGGKKTRGD